MACPVACIRATIRQNAELLIFLDQEDLGRPVVPQVLVHLPQGQVVRQNKTLNAFCSAQRPTARPPAQIIRRGSARMLSFYP